MIEHGTVAGARHCRTTNGAACPACATAWNQYEQGRRLLHGKQRTVLVPVEVLALLLEGSPRARAAARVTLGAGVCTAIVRAAERYGAEPLGQREYRRLTEAGVNPTTAALLAEYRQEVA